MSARAEPPAWVSVIFFSDCSRSFGQAGGVDLELHVGQREAHGLVLDDLLAELLALLGVVERVLVGGAGDADRLGADGRAAGLEGLHRGLLLGAGALARAGEALVELL